jgi:hypothetical protein
MIINNATATSSWIQVYLIDLKIVFPIYILFNIYVNKKPENIGCTNVAIRQNITNTIYDIYENVPTPT